ncbi:MAG: hypothetical protein WBA97_24070 [Actinophytocola sp.]|uniref:hypothetical protein n=1 Tax=Actinophytocola sp. TaxID=1872138 RepID=UPI003C770CC9
MTGVDSLNIAQDVTRKEQSATSNTKTDPSERFHGEETTPGDGMSYPRLPSASAGSQAALGRGREE